MFSNTIVGHVKDRYFHSEREKLEGEEKAIGWRVNLVRQIALDLEA